MILNLIEGPLSIFRTFRHLLVAIHELVAAIEDLAKAQTSATPAMDRLDALELSRDQFEAHMEGLYLKADGKFKAASNAEARERKMKESYEKDSDSFDEGGEAGPGGSPILPVDVEAGEAERVSALHLGLAPNNKTAALAHKFAR